MRNRGDTPMLLAIGAIIIVATATLARAAEPAPHWEIGEICASSSLGPHCPRIESQNRASLLLRWEAVPIEARQVC